jgi:hypothetical protein
MSARRISKQLNMEQRKESYVQRTKEILLGNDFAHNYSQKAREHHKMEALKLPL